jgi:DNA mismatch repair protein MutL
MGKIQQLPEHLINQIAAGEVVLHPASVGKELLENAIDAGATMIEIRLEEGGVRRLEVIDNGVGMSFVDLSLAVLRHATSKIRQLEDLQSLTSLGFRGEALPSIAAVARLSIESSPQDFGDASAERQGGIIELHGGQMIRHEPKGVPPGTRIVVEDLFYSMPARRKFLKSDAYEFQRLQKIVYRLALAYPQIGFKLFHNNKPVSFFPQQGDHRQRLQQVLGAGKTGSQLSPWNDHLLEARDERGEMKLQVFFTSPHASFASREQQFLFLNRRMISDRSLTHALQEAYRTFVMEHRYPGVVLFLEMSASEFDVNVHPSKEEVRFSNAAQLHQWVVQLLRRQLSSYKFANANFEVPTTELPPMLLLGEQAPLGYFSASTVRTAPQESLPLSEEGSSEVLTYRHLKLIGQLQNCYILCEGPSGLVILDQHAAHERVRFEQIRQQMATRSIPCQQLLEPQLLRLKPLQIKTFNRQPQLLEQLGYDVEPFGPQSNAESVGADYLLRAVPTWGKLDSLQLFTELLDDLEAHGSSLTLEAARDRCYATMACHSAVRFHQSLSEAEMQQLLVDLALTAGSSNCPHGRPVFIQVSEQEL